MEAFSVSYNDNDQIICKVSSKRNKAKENTTLPELQAHLLNGYENLIHTKILDAFSQRP